MDTLDGLSLADEQTPQPPLSSSPDPPTDLSDSPRQGTRVVVGTRALVFPLRGLWPSWDKDAGIMVLSDTTRAFHKSLYCR